MDTPNASASAVFFRKLPRLFFAGLIFSAALALCLGASILAGRLTGFNNIIIYALGLIPAAVFYPGLIEIIRKYAVERNCVPVVKTFFKAVKRNLPSFLLHGVAVYAVSACTFFAVIYYGTLAQSNVTFGYVLGIYVIFASILVMMMFYAPLISASYKVRLREAYKNALALTFSKILRSLLLLLVFCAMAAGAYFLIRAASTSVFALVCCVAAVAVVYPLLFTYINVAAVSDAVQQRMGSFIKKPLPEAEPAKITVNLDNSEDDYIFVNGKMIKNPNKK